MFFLSRLLIVNDVLNSNLSEKREKETERGTEREREGERGRLRNTERERGRQR